MNADASIYCSDINIILANVDAQYIDKTKDTNRWIKILIVELQQFLHSVGMSNNKFSVAIAKNCIDLIVRRRYGSLTIKNAIFDQFKTLIDDWCSSECEQEGDDEIETQSYDAKKMHETSLDARRFEVVRTLGLIESLGWLKMHSDVLIQALYVATKSHVRETCINEYEKFFLPELLSWLDRTLMPLVEHALGSTASVTIQPLLSLSLHKSLSEIRAQELFNIVADFPDSIYAVKELKEAMSRAGTLTIVGKEFKNAVNKRLLHMGASTTQIVSFYVSMIRALRVMDSSDLLLNYVAAPVRLYLTERKDTVRCVVSALMEGKGSELHGELRKGGSLEYGPDEDDEEAGPGDHWEPRRRNPDLMEAGGRGLDVLALLVSIYGSTDLFVSDYRSVLADKLLSSNLDYRADQELATLELLKIRFGEDALHCCEVMLRDLEESRRTNTMLMQQTGVGKNEIRVDCLILSDNYWPALQSDSITLPPAPASALASYQTAYAETKKPRKLQISSQLGLVDLDLHFNDGCVRNFLVTPAQATLIMLLAEGEPSGTSLHSLAAQCELEDSDVERRIGFWIAREVVCMLRAGPTNEIFYVVVEEQSNRSSSMEGSEMDVENQQMTVGADVNEKASLIQFETYVKGLLTNHGSMTLERIYTMLKLISSGGSSGGGWKFDMNLVELKKCLQSFVDQDKLMIIDGQYRIRVVTK